MTVDLKWRDAMTSAQWAFDAVQRAAGWPESMAPRQLAALQRPWVRTDRTSKTLCEALMYALLADCNAGQLPHTVTSKVVQRQWSKEIPVRFESMYYDGSIGKIRTVHGTEDVEFKTLHIEAATFADWLRKQGEEPSQHIAHWFKVRGVAAPAVLQLTPPAPAIDAVVKPDDTAPAIPTTWAELVAWTGRKAPGFRWTDDLRLILATEKKRRTDLRHTGIAQAMGDELGCSGKNVNDRIAEMGKPGSREQVLGRAIASLSNGTNGKNGR